MSRGSTTTVEVRTEGKADDVRARFVLWLVTSVVVYWAIFAHFDGLAAWGMVCAYIGLRHPRVLK